MFVYFHYSQQARLDTLHANGDLDILNIDGPDPEGAAIVVASRRRIAARAKADQEEQTNLSKQLLISYHTDIDVDETKRLEKKDFCSFGGKHQGTSVLLYSVPNLGWEPDATAQEGKMLGKLTTRELEEKQQANMFLPRIRKTANRLK